MKTTRYMKKDHRTFSMLFCKEFVFKNLYTKNAPYVKVKGVYFYDKRFESFDLPDEEDKDWVTSNRPVRLIVCLTMILIKIDICMYVHIPR